jgi:hypothetical protein
MRDLRLGRLVLRVALDCRDDGSTFTRQRPALVAVLTSRTADRRRVMVEQVTRVPRGSLN